MAAGKKSKGRSTDPWANLTPDNTAQSNQLRISGAPAGRSFGTGTVGNQQKSQANTKGTGDEDVPSAVALRGKRKSVTLPFNQNA